MKSYALALGLAVSVSSFASMPSNPVTDRDFGTLPDGRNLSSIEVGSSPLTLSKGSGVSFTTAQNTKYKKKLKT